MASLRRSLRSLLPVLSKEEPEQSGKIFAYDIVTALDDGKGIPPELRYIIARNAKIKEHLRSTLKSGRTVAARTIIRTPPRLLEAVHNIAVHSQHRLILSWLRPLLRDDIMPRVTEKDTVATSALGIDLDEEINIIRDYRYEFDKIVLLDEHGNEIA